VQNPSAARSGRASRHEEKCVKEAEGEVMPPPDARPRFWSKLTRRDACVIAVKSALILGWIGADQYLKLNFWARLATGFTVMIGFLVTQRLADKWFRPDKPLP
jgi:hypothetical protein